MKIKSPITGPGFRVEVLLVTRSAFDLAHATATVELFIELGQCKTQRETVGRPAQPDDVISTRSRR